MLRNPVGCGLEPSPARNISRHIELRPFGVTRPVLELFDLSEELVHEPGEPSISLGIFRPGIDHQKRVIGDRTVRPTSPRIGCSTCSICRCSVPTTITTKLSGRACAVHHEALYCGVPRPGAKRHKVLFGPEGREGQFQSQVVEEGMSQNDVAEAIESLVDKSMVEAGVNTHETSYMLLDTTRTYALEKLLQRGEHDAIATRHSCG